MPINPSKPIVICDTNIWYGLADGTIPDYEARQYNLIGTDIVVFELSNPIKLATDFLLMQRVIRAFYNYHASIISCNPLSHLVGLFVRNLPLKSDCHYYLKSFTEILRTRIIGNVLPSEFIIHCQRMQTDRIGWMNEITVPANEALSTIIRPGIKSSGGKQKHKLKERQSSTKSYLSELICSHAKTEFGLDLVIPADAPGWSQMELFFYVHDAFYLELEISKRNFTNNDLSDLFNIAYVQPGQYYWTKEKFWNTLIHRVGLSEKYILPEHQKTKS